MSRYWEFMDIPLGIKKTKCGNCQQPKTKIGILIGDLERCKHLEDCPRNKRIMFGREIDE